MSNEFGKITVLPWVEFFIQPGLNPWLIIPLWDGAEFLIQLADRGFVR